MLRSRLVGHAPWLSLLVLVVLVATTGALAVGAPSAKGPEEATFTLTGDVTDLYPGATAPATVTVRNTYPWPILVRQIRVQVVDSDRSGCAAVNVWSPGWNGVVRIAKGGSAEVAVPFSMSAGAPGACQGATFSLVYSGTGDRA